MRRAQPDLFIHCGDTIYADAPLVAEVKLDDGRVWRNVVTRGEVEGRRDARRVSRQLPVQPHRRAHAALQRRRRADGDLGRSRSPRQLVRRARPESRTTRYQVKSMALLAERARQAFLEHHPIAIDPGNRDRIHRTLSLGPQVEVFALDMRSFRGREQREPAGARSTASSSILGAAQLDWLKTRLAASRATWKVIASDMPIGVIVPRHAVVLRGGRQRRPTGRRSAASSRSPICCASSSSAGVRNVVWITGDVHYCAAHHYDPARARFTDFDPFWEFVAGPLHCRHVRPERARSDVRSRGAVHRRPAGHEAESAAV